MGWSESFLNKIRTIGATHKPRYLVESLSAYGVNELGGTLRLSTHPYQYYSPIIALTGHSFTAASARPGEWSTTVAEAKIAVTTESDFRTQARRGQLAQFKVGFAGWSPGDFQPVLTGRVQDVTRVSGDKWTVTLRSVAGDLSSRMTSESAQEALFYDFTAVYGTSTTIDGVAYAGGDPTIRVLDATHAKETGGAYLISVVPALGNEFFLRSTSNTLGGPEFFNGLSSVYGPAPVNAPIGAEVRKYWYIQDHPVNVVRKVVTSTGSGVNGAYDTLPETWGIGLPDEILDHDDMDVAIDVSSPTTGSAVWDVYGQDPVTDGLSWMNGFLNPAGLFICERQGKLTVRAALPSTIYHYDLVVINDEDIISIDGYNTWDPGTPAEYSSVALNTNNSVSTTTETLTTRPARPEFRSDLPFIDPVANGAAWRSSLLDRVAPWYTRIPETLTVTLVGWRFAGVAPGSMAVINSKYLVTKSRQLNETWFVVSADADWFGSSTTVVLAHIPESELDP